MEDYKQIIIIQRGYDYIWNIIIIKIAPERLICNIKIVKGNVNETCIKILIFPNLIFQFLLKYRKY